jgi:hypothetical protein
VDAEDERYEVMSAYQKLVQARDAVFHAMGWVPRQFDVPETEGSIERLNAELHARSHAALRRRIKGE